jgi:osmoprotectant transport system permease protein
MRRLILSVVALLIVAAWPRASTPRGLRVASKIFTESVILGEMVTQLVRAGGDHATHLAELGGTTLVYDALRRGEVDVYPEYTGTLREEIFAGRDAATIDKLQALLADQGILMSPSLGFSNNYALAVRRDVAKRLGLATITDLARQTDLRLGLSNEFLDRADGWKNLRTHYGLPHEQVTGLDHNLAYKQLEAGEIDVTDAYATDAEVAELDLVLLADDRAHFPSYDAVLLSRSDLAERFPAAAKQIALLESQISQQEMRELNALVQAGAKNEAQAAAKFLIGKLSIAADVQQQSVAAQIWQRTLEHCDLVRRSLIPAVLVAVPLGVLAAKRPRLGRIVLGAAGIVQTVPALALLVLLIAPVAYLNWDTLGAGSATAIIALFLYSLLPMVQNTATGLATIPREYHESAAALGLSPSFRLLHIELPLASPAILAGVKTAAVLNVGFATLGALVGARGYGQPILTGIRLNNTGLILQGAVPAACLAILLQLAFELVERRLLPAGLRPDSPRASDASTH